MYVLEDFKLSKRQFFSEFPYFKNKRKRAFQVFFLYIYTV